MHKTLYLLLALAGGVPLLAGCPGPLLLLSQTMMGHPSPYLLAEFRLGHCLGPSGALGSLEVPRLWGLGGEGWGRVGWGEGQGCRPGEKGGGDLAHTEVAFEKVEFDLVAWGLEILVVDFVGG